MNFDFDLFVIGGGSGGVRAARLAGARGLKVGLAEGDRMGGTCVIRGCVPKKLMLFGADFEESFALAQGYGWEFGEPKFEWSNFQSKLQNELNRLEGIYENILESNNVRSFNAYASLDDAHHVALDNGLRFSAERILIATGGRPFVPEFEGREHVLVSDDIFHMEKLPKSILIKGGGYIATEFAGILHGFGVDVTLLVRSDLILRGYDLEMRQLISDAMQARGIKIIYNDEVQSLTADGATKHIALTSGQSLTVEEVLVATGRVPNIEELELEQAGVKFGKSGIEVDEFSQSSVENIYAIGDVTGRAALTPVAIREAVNFISTVYENMPRSVDYSLIPTAIFTRPEFGTIGMGEEAAREAGFDIDVYFTKFRTMFAGFAEGDAFSAFKVIVDKATDRVLGVHILGHGAGEMIQMVGIAVTMGVTKAQLDATIAVHPTASEELVTLKSPRTP